MTRNDITALMHAVLDGEATPREAGELDRILSSDESARREYDALRALFSDLKRVPAASPPPEFTASVMERVAPRPQRPGRWRQLFHRSSVHRGGASEARGVPGDPSGHPSGVRKANLTGEGNKTMSEQNRNSGNGKIWIGTGIAAAAVIFGVYYATDFPSSGDGASGTIAPAQRYRANQPTAGDVKLGEPSAAGGTQASPAGQVGSAAAANEAATRSNEAAVRSNDAAVRSNEAASRSANEAAVRSNEAASRSANEAAVRSNEAASRSANEAAVRSNEAASRSANEAAVRSNEAASRSANEAANRSANEAAQKATNQAASRSANEAANRSANEAAQKAANQAAAKAANEAAAKASNEAMKK